MRAGFIYTWAVIGLAALLPTYLLRFSIAGIPTNFLEIAILLVAMFSLLQPGIRRQWAPAWRALPRRLILLAALFLLASVMATVISSQPRVSLGILKGWIITPLILGWLVYAGGKQRFVIQALIYSGVVMALLSISQLGVLDRVRGIYDVPNSLALYLVPIFMLAVGLRQWWQAVVMGVAILATQSVGAVAALGVTLLIHFWAKARNPNIEIRNNIQILNSNNINMFRIWNFVLRICFGFVISYFVLFWYWPRLVYLTAPLYNPNIHNSISVRTQLWDISWQLIREQPLLGIGLGQFEPAYQAVLAQRQGAIPEYVLRDSHNWILSFWLNTGLLGLISFAGINGYVLWRALKTPSNSPSLEGENLKPFPSSEGRLGGVIAVALIALLLYGLVETIYWKNDLAALQWMLVALGTNAIGGASLAARTSIGLARFAAKL